jgi:hypothetical protein
MPQAPWQVVEVVPTTTPKRAAAAHPALQTARPYDRNPRSEKHIMDRRPGGGPHPSAGPQRVLPWMHHQVFSPPDIICNFEKGKAYGL